MTSSVSELSGPFRLAVPQQSASLERPQTASVGFETLSAKRLVFASAPAPLAGAFGRAAVPQSQRPTLRGRDITPAGYQAAIRRLRSDPSFRMSAEVRRGVEKFTANEREIVAVAFNLLGDVKSGSINQARYMIAVMEAAERLSPKDPKEFADLIGLVFNERKTKWFETPRKILGAGFRPEGWEIEKTFEQTTRDHGVAAGYNENIIDGESKRSSVTHHYGELLRVGVRSWRWAGMFAQYYIDSGWDIVNPGDIRSGYFAVMLGNAIADGKVTNADAVRLTEWAFVSGARVPPPWGTKESGTYLKQGDYRIRPWVEAFNRAHPAKPSIRLQ